MTGIGGAGAQVFAIVSAAASSRGEQGASPDHAASGVGQNSENKSIGGAGASIPGTKELTPEERQQVQELRTQDQRVRQHERAHIAAGGRYITSGARFRYQTGPDGHQYAVAGEVSISTSRESTPEATLEKAAVVRRAALAPADPSPQDRAVAAKATQLETEARRELAQERLDEGKDGDLIQEKVSQGEPGTGSPAIGSKSPSAGSDRSASTTNLFPDLVAGQLLDLFG